MTIEGGEYNHIKIASVNTFLDGINADRSIKSWVGTQAKIYSGNEKLLHEQQLNNTEKHPVEQIIAQYGPDVIIANEVVHAPWGSETMNQLKSHGYDHVVEGRLGSTVMASKLPGELIEVPVTDQKGASFCGLKIHDRNLIVIGLQASAFFPHSRRQQIKEVLQFCKVKLNDGFQVIVAGDFNDELKKHESGIHMDFVDLTKPTFPHKSLLKSLSELPKVPRKIFEKVFSLSNGVQRSLDHILFSKGGEIIDFNSVETTSDHLGLVADIKFQSKKEKVDDNPRQY